MSLPHIDIDDIERSCIQEKQNEPFINSFVKRLLYTLAKDKYAATNRDYFLSTAYAVKDFPDSTTFRKIFSFSSSG